MLNNIKTYLAINILSCYIKTISRYTRTIIKLISKFRQKYGTLVKPVTKVVFPVVSSIHSIVASSTIFHISISVFWLCHLLLRWDAESISFGLKTD